MSLEAKKKDFLPFQEAREFVRNIGLKTCKEWVEYCKSGNRPENIPSNPDKQYKDKGWISLMDWLGTDNVVGSKKKDFLPFEEAREFIRNLELKTWNEWVEYCKSGNRPENIPSHPDMAYKDKGWISLMDWLGTDNVVGSKKKDFLPFQEAREFARNLELKGLKEWVEYCKSGNRPKNIPSNPQMTYKDKGWVSFGDWLGNDNKKFCKKDFLPFEEARKFVRNIGLKGKREWKIYCKSGLKPSFIPSKPEITYKNKGWISWMDWLGTDNVARS